ncbi:MAG: TetR/AcrR family transcriptional regulator [Nitrospirales bacterium]|nr:TetR/AcrR family transcriptional regulator [Nitrospira sp.]MDR4500608.1 TetR/AcrR family transcriptional regulator [Nitrospirales bacterium]
MRKRPRKGGSSRLSGAERRASIIASAASQFAARGFTGAKTKAIAEHAGVSEALLFKHFPSKNELYAAILAKASPVPDILHELKVLADQQDDKQVFTFIARTIVRHAPDIQLMRLLLFSALEEHELSDMFFQNHVRVFYEFLAGYLDRRMKEGAFRTADPLLSARAFMGMLIYHRLLSQIFNMPVKKNPQEIEETFVSIFLDGLRAGHVPSPKQKPTRRNKPHSPRKRTRV